MKAPLTVKLVKAKVRKTRASGAGYFLKHSPRQKRTYENSNIGGLWESKGEGTASKDIYQKLIYK